MGSDRGRAAQGAQPEPPLLVTADPEVLVAVQRAAASVDVEVQVLGSDRARRRWSAAPMVVLGADQLTALVELGLPRRPGLVVVSTGDGPGPGSGEPATDVRVWQGAVLLGAERVVRLPADEAWLAARFGDLLAGVGATVVGVLGAVGGCGVSTLAAALAVVASEDGRSVLLVDTDRHGGGLDLVLGAEEEPGSRWPQLAGARGAVAASTLLDVLPGVAELPDLRVLSCARVGSEETTGEQTAGATDDGFRAVLAGAVRGFDLVVVDLGRGAGVPGVALRELDACLVVVPLRLRAMAAATSLLAQHDELAARVRLLARDPSAGGLDVADLRAAVGHPVLARVPDDPGRAGDEERAEPPGRRARSPLARLSRELLAELVPLGRAA